jgi:hypothetical protein
LPLPLMHRSIAVHMERTPRHISLERFDAKNPEQMEEFRLIKVYALYPWSRAIELNPEPAMPSRLHNRRADNWRVLIAIADACHRGDIAREAAIALVAQHQDEDPGVELLLDIRRVFDSRRADRLSSAEMLSELHAFDDACWSDWRGTRGDQPPHKLSRSELSAFLLPFGIKSRSVWLVGVPRQDDKSRKGYLRSQFEAAWNAYCRDGEDGTPTQRSSIRHLRVL